MPTAEHKPKGLHAKLAEVMAEAERIPKNGSYKEPGEYGHFKFVQVGDAADHIRKALGDRGVSMLPTAVEMVGETEHSTKSGGTMTTMTVRTTWTLVDGETGETAQIQSLGTGADAGDKASPKAQTNAMKYALLMGFLLSTGDDPEQSDSSDRQTRQRPVGEYKAPPERPPLTRETGPDGLIGKVVAAGSQDFELRPTPDGAVLPFRIKDSPNRAGQIVVAHNALAEALALVRDDVIGQTVTVWGTYSDENGTKPDGFVFEYKVLHLEKIRTPEFTLPAADTMTAPMFPDAAEEAAILAAEEEEAKR